MDNSGNDLMRMIFNINESMGQLNTHNLFQEIEEEDNYISSFNIPSQREIEQQFITNMMQLLVRNNNEFTNENMNNMNNITNFIQESFNQKNKYKKVTSEKGLNQLKKIKYSNTMNQKECPIFMTKFQEGEEITQLPCKHLFNSTAIEKWLKEEQHMCPVCRFELDYDEIEIKKKFTPIRNTIIQEIDSSNNNVSEVEDISENNLSNNMSNNDFLNVLFRPLLPTRNIEPMFNNLLNVESEINTDRQLQEAIMASLNQETDNNE